MKHPSEEGRKLGQNVTTHVTTFAGHRQPLATALPAEVLAEAQAKILAALVANIGTAPLPTPTAPAPRTYGLRTCARCGILIGRNTRECVVCLSVDVERRCGGGA